MTFTPEDIAKKYIKEQKGVDQARIFILKILVELSPIMSVKG